MAPSGLCSEIVRRRWGEEGVAKERDRVPVLRQVSEGVLKVGAGTAQTGARARHCLRLLQRFEAASSGERVLLYAGTQYHPIEARPADTVGTAADGTSSGPAGLPRRATVRGGAPTATPVPVPHIWSFERAHALS